ncbi:hypothetical protein LWI29_016296 [Acer saccharum]|uniref:Uncharacterized protein n=1 Tax=Acer saccharum TaxID=4024 RepID=A0AA39SSN9_ACESA|nr:hypothetical protein LWI29_016296 [Acer saccharum]
MVSSYQSGGDQHSNGNVRGSWKGRERIHRGPNFNRYHQEGRSYAEAVKEDSTLKSETENVDTNQTFRRSRRVTYPAGDSRLDRGRDEEEEDSLFLTKEKLESRKHVRKGAGCSQGQQGIEVGGVRENVNKGKGCWVPRSKSRSRVPSCNGSLWIETKRGVNREQKRCGSNSISSSSESDRGPIMYGLLTTGECSYKRPVERGGSSGPIVGKNGIGLPVVSKKPLRNKETNGNSAQSDSNSEDSGDLSPRNSDGASLRSFSGQD